MSDTKAKPSRSRQILWLALRLIVVIAIFYFVFRAANIDVDSLREEASQIRWPLVGASYVIWVFSIYVASFRWKLLLNVVRDGVSVNDLVAFNAVGIFYAQFLPGMVSGDVVKGYYLARDGDEKVKVMSSALMDRVLGITVNGLLGLGALAASPLIMETFDLQGYIPFLVFGLVLVGLVVAFAMVRFLERFESRFPKPIQAVFEPVRLYARHPFALGGAAVASVFYFIFWTLALWVLAASVGLGYLGFFTILLVLAVVNVAQFLPLTINGAGLREGAVVAVLSTYGVADEKALVYALLIPLTALGLALIGGLLVLLDYRGDRKAQATATTADEETD